MDPKNIKKNNTLPKNSNQSTGRQSSPNKKSESKSKGASNPKNLKPTSKKPSKTHSTAKDQSKRPEQKTTKPLEIKNNAWGNGIKIHDTLTSKLSQENIKNNQIKNQYNMNNTPATTNPLKMTKPMQSKAQKPTKTHPQPSAFVPAINRSVPNSPATQNLSVNHSKTGFIPKQPKGYFAEKSNQFEGISYDKANMFLSQERMWGQRGIAKNVPLNEKNSFKINVNHNHSVVISSQFKNNNNENMQQKQWQKDSANKTSERETILKKHVNVETVRLNPPVATPPSFKPRYQSRALAITDPNTKDVIKPEKPALPEAADSKKSSVTGQKKSPEIAESSTRKLIEDVIDRPVDTKGTQPHIPKITEEKRLEAETRPETPKTTPIDAPKKSEKDDEKDTENKTEKDDKKPPQETKEEEVIDIFMKMYEERVRNPKPKENLKPEENNATPSPSPYKKHSAPYVPPPMRKGETGVRKNITEEINVVYKPGSLPQTIKPLRNQSNPIPRQFPSFNMNITSYQKNYQTQNFFDTRGVVNQLNQNSLNRLDLPKVSNMHKGRDQGILKKGNKPTFPSKIEKKPPAPAPVKDSRKEAESVLRTTQKEVEYALRTTQKEFKIPSRQAAPEFEIIEGEINNLEDVEKRREAKPIPFLLERLMKDVPEAVKDQLFKTKYGKVNIKNFWKQIGRGSVDSPSMNRRAKNPINFGRKYGTMGSYGSKMPSTQYSAKTLTKMLAKPIPRPKKRAKSKRETMVDTFNNCLNKLSEKNIEKITPKILEAIREVDSEDGENYRILVDAIFRKAVGEQNYSKIYTKLMSKLEHKLKLLRVVFKEGEEAKDLNLNELMLINIRRKFNESADGGNLSEEKKLKAKSEALGNIKLAGELFLAGRFQPRAMYRCVMTLFKKDEPSEEDYDIVCKLLRTVGAELDQKNGKENKRMINRIYEKVEKHMKRMENNRNRFLLQDILTLRSNGWTSVEVKAKPGAGKKLRMASMSRKDPNSPGPVKKAVNSWTKEHKDISREVQKDVPPKVVNYRAKFDKMLREKDSECVALWKFVSSLDRKQLNGAMSDFIYVVVELYNIETKKIDAVIDEAIRRKLFTKSNTRESLEKIFTEMIEWEMDYPVLDRFFARMLWRLIREGLVEASLLAVPKNANALKTIGIKVLKMLFVLNVSDSKSTALIARSLGKCDFGAMDPEGKEKAKLGELQEYIKSGLKLESTVKK